MTGFRLFVLLTVLELPLPISEDANETYSLKAGFQFSHQRQKLTHSAVTIVISVSTDVGNTHAIQQSLHRKLTNSNALMKLHISFGDRGSTVVKVLCYKSEGR